MLHDQTEQSYNTNEMAIELLLLLQYNSIRTCDQTFDTFDGSFVDLVAGQVLQVQVNLLDVGSTKENKFL